MGLSLADCDPPISAWVETAVASLVDELGTKCIGAYLHGSLASGSFYPPKSDVDLLFVAASSLSVDERRAFAEACVRIHEDRPIVGGLECSVILGADAAAAPYPMPFEVHFGEEWVDDIRAGRIDHGRGRTDPDLAAHCQALLENGLCLWGEPIAQLFGPVSRADFLDAVRGDLDWILERDNILESPVYGVLNCCRALWLWSGHSSRLAPSKEEAGLWAAEAVPEHRVLLDEALLAYRDPRLVDVHDRKTAGRQWDRERLLSFRDWIRASLVDGPRWSAPRGLR